MITADPKLYMILKMGLDSIILISNGKNSDLGGFEYHGYDESMIHSIALNTAIPRVFFNLPNCKSVVNYYMDYPDDNGITARAKFILTANSDDNQVITLHYKLDGIEYNV